MNLKELSECLVMSSCGLCCSKKVLCAKCEISTLKANGLSETLQPLITGLSYCQSGYSGGGFKYSDLGKKLIELRSHKCI